ncbi:MAG: hypothetical protein J6Y16_04915, partial [Treponema sp.]|nr:hypothetical protein [Treponema sp.]
MKAIKHILVFFIFGLVLASSVSCKEKSSSRKNSSSSSSEVNEMSKPPSKPDGNGGDGAPPGGGFGGGHASANIDYSGATEISSAQVSSDKIYSTDTVDQSALLVSTKDSVQITNATVTKTGDSDGGDSCNFYGLNAAVLVKDGSTTT